MSKELWEGITYLKDRIAYLKKLDNELYRRFEKFEADHGSDVSKYMEEQTMERDILVYAGIECTSEGVRLSGILSLGELAVECTEAETDPSAMN